MTTSEQTERPGGEPSEPVPFSERARRARWEARNAVRTSLVRIERVARRELEQRKAVLSADIQLAQLRVKKSIKRSYFAAAFSVFASLVPVGLSVHAARPVLEDESATIQRVDVDHYGIDVPSWLSPVFDEVRAEPVAVVQEEQPEARPPAARPHPAPIAKPRPAPKPEKAPAKGKVDPCTGADAFDPLNFCLD